MKRAVVLLAALALVRLLTFRAAASDAEALLKTEADPENGLSEQVISELGPYDPDAEPELPQRLWDLFRSAVSHTELLGIREGIRNLGLLLGAILLSGLLRTYADGIPEAAGCLAVTLICADGVRSMLGLGVQTVEEIHSYLRLLLPGLGSLMAASGRLTGAGTVTAGAILGFDLFAALLDRILTPLVWLRAGLCAAGAILGLDTLDQLRDFLKWASTGILKLVLWLFFGLLTAADLFSGAADARQLKAARFAISGMIPGVGNLVSDASGALLNAASMLKASVGLYGMLAAAAICLTPFLRIWIRYLVLRLATALGGLLGKGRTLDLVGQMAELTGTVLAMTGIACILAMLSLTLCVRTVSG